MGILPGVLTAIPNACPESAYLPEEKRKSGTEAVLLFRLYKIQEEPLKDTLEVGGVGLRQISLTSNTRCDAE